MKARTWLSGRWFQFVHGNHLVYNTCWEDPRLDHVALDLGPQDTVVAITSAGCNVLDYLLAEPRHVWAVDLNPYQNALLELKLAGIRRLDFATYFALFGKGRHREFRDIYASCLRNDLSAGARSFWDGRYELFAGSAGASSFYFRGTTGWFARWINSYIDRVGKCRDSIERAFHATTIDEQRQIYESELYPRIWGPAIRWLLRRDATLALLGVPWPQRRQLDEEYQGGIVRFVEDSLRAVFAELPLADNYFWRVYLNGRYTPDCCPEYLKPENFARLKAGLVDRVTVRTVGLRQFLEQHDSPVSRYVLLDHMDWLSAGATQHLDAEWQAIVDRAAPGARLLWRSAGTRTDFVDRVEIEQAGRRCRVGELLRYDRPLAQRLHAEDRVHTYGSFHVADLAA